MAVLSGQAQIRDKYTVRRIRISEQLISLINNRNVDIAYTTQLSLKWLLIINYETYLYIFVSKFSLKNTNNRNLTLNSKSDAMVS